MHQQQDLFIGGEWRRPRSDRRITVVSPNSGGSIGSVPEAGEADVDAAVSAARAAFEDPEGWARWEPRRRAEVLRRFADALDRRGEETARLVSSQNGMPIVTSSAVEAVFPGVLLRYYADLVVDTAHEELREPVAAAGKTLVTREALGVVAAIVPWNFPQGLAAYKYAPALAAGCTLVIKPSPETVLDSVPLAEAATEAGIPPGVINIVPGGAETGAHLVSHPGVDAVAFTGSTAVGRRVGEVCGRLLRPVTLELGGKSAAIILDDVDFGLPGLGDGVYGATLANNGQACFACSRILAPRSRYAETVDFFTGLAGSLTVGDSLDPATRIGPVVSERQRERIEGYIRTGVTEGARIAFGGGRPDGLAGWFVEPTIFADVDNHHTIAREEIFGPVLSVIAYDDEDDAVRIANDSDFGLAGTVWTQDEGRGLAVARRVETGSFGVNTYTAEPTAPFGGVKASGLGSELGPEALQHFQRVKSIYL